MERSRTAPPDGRRGRGRPRLPVDRIIATALELVAEQGAAALSLRNLAERLGSSTSTLYRHFPSRAHLTAQVVDSLFAEAAHAEMAITDSWQDDCREVAGEMFASLTRTPGAAALLLEQIPSGPNAVRLREHVLQVLLKAGFPPRSAARSYATFARFVLGFAIQQSAPVDQPAADAVAIEWARGVDPAELPATAAIADHFLIPLPEEFSFGLELLLEGLRAHLEQERAGTPARRPRSSAHR